MVNSWETIGQPTWTAAMEGERGYVYSKVQASENETPETMWDYAGNNAQRDMPYGWWGTGLLNPSEYDADNMHAKFKVMQAGSLANGFCFNVTKNEDDLYYPVDQVGNRKSSTPVPTINGYFFNVSHHGNSTYHTLFKAENWRLDNSFSAECGRNGAEVETYDQNYNTSNGHVYRRGWMTGNTIVWCHMATDMFKMNETVTSWRGEKFTKLAEWTTEPNCDSNRWELIEGDREITYEVECRNGEIRIWDDSKAGRDADESTRRKLRDDGGAPVVSVKDSQFEKGTYGFWGNNCEQKGQSRFADLSVEITKTKSFGDIVYEPTWTDGALHMLINMDTKSDPTMLGKDGRGLLRPHDMHARR